MLQQRLKRCLAHAASQTGKRDKPNESLRQLRRWVVFSQDSVKRYCSINPHCADPISSTLRGRLRAGVTRQCDVFNF